MTENVTHTPGPWLYENGNGIIGSGNPLKVAGRTKVAIANRRLIAAAPELLEVLQQLADADFGPEQNEAAYNSVCMKARAVIAKATAP